MSARKRTKEQAMDPVLFEVLKHKLLSITWEQSNTLKKVSGSPVVTEANDFNTGLYLGDGSIVTLGRQMIWQTGAMANVIRSVISDCRDNPGIDDGDMFICNDPYKGALHGSDVSLGRPDFFRREAGGLGRDGRASDRHGRDGRRLLVPAGHRPGAGIHEPSAPQADSGRRGPAGHLEHRAQHDPPALPAGGSTSAP